MLDIFPILKSLWRNKTGPLLMVLQLSLTIAIISNALFFVKERADKIARPTGMAEEEVVAMRMRRIDPGIDIQAIVERDMEVIRSVPGVIAAAAISSIPVSNSGSSAGVSKEPDEKSERFPAGFYLSSEQLLTTLDLVIVEGRNFYDNEVTYYEPGNMPTHSAVLISKSLAERIFPDESAIGKTLYVNKDLLITVIGIVERLIGPWPSATNLMDTLILPNMVKRDSINYVIRTDKKSRHEILLTVAEKLRAIEHGRLIMDEQTLEAIKRRSYVDEHAMIKILAVVIAMLVFVNVLGILGLTSFWVTQRRKQIGIRRALGATKAAVMRYFMVENILLVIFSAIAGGTIALIASSYMARAYGVALLPWQYLPITAGGVLLITLLAAVSPIRRASLISPVEAVAGA